MSRIAFRFLFVAILVIVSAAAFGHSPARAAGPWYVSTTGNDANDCLSPATPCFSISGAVVRASNGDTINVATGTYFGAGTDVILLNQDAVLSGGWNESFTAKNGLSIVDGQGSRRGLAVFGTATVDSFFFRDGTASNTNTAGGILNIGTLILANSVVSDNAEDFGGGISNVGTLTLNNSVVSNNSASTFGGGILNNGTLTLNNSTVSGNSSTQFGGGGIANSGGTVTLNNSTISGNFTGDGGAGILNSGGPTTGTVTLNYTTVSNNTAAVEGGGIASYSATGAITLNSSIVAGNTVEQSGFNQRFADCIVDLVVSQGYNLTGTGEGGCNALGGPGDVNVAPADVFTTVLSALADNGGPTQTHALIPGPSNPALDAIPSGTNNCGSAPFDVDQRGVARPQGAQCDRGAFEWQETGGGADVTIDILPGSSVNPINMSSTGTVPVAILSTIDFDARALVNRSSLTFGASGNEASLASCNSKASDVNRDGRPDLVCHFFIQLTGFERSSQIGILKGTTLDGTPFEASDVVKILKKQ